MIIEYRLDVDNDTKEFAHSVNGHGVKTKKLNFGLLGDIYLPIFSGKMIKGLPGYFSDSGKLNMPEFFFSKLVFSGATLAMIDKDTIGNDKLLRATIIIKRRKL